MQNVIIIIAKGCRNILVIFYQAQISCSHLKLKSSFCGIRAVVGKAGMAIFHLKFLAVKKLSKNLILVKKFHPTVQNLGLKTYFLEI